METYCQKSVAKSKGFEEKDKRRGWSYRGGEGAVQGSINIEGGVQIFCAVYDDT